MTPSPTPAGAEPPGGSVATAPPPLARAAKADKRMRRRVALTLAAGATAIAGLALAVLLQAPARIVSTNRIAATVSLGELKRHTTACQSQEVVPAATNALRLSVAAYLGPAIWVTIEHRGQVVARGHHPAHWVSSALTVPLGHAVKATVHATVCLRRDNSKLAANLVGSEQSGPAAASLSGASSPGRLRIEYLAPGHRSWLARALYVVRRFGLGRAPSGGVLAVLVAAGMMLAVALAAWLLLHDTDDRQAAGGGRPPPGAEGDAST